MIIEVTIAIIVVMRQITIIHHHLPVILTYKITPQVWLCLAARVPVVNKHSYFYRTLQPQRTQIQMCTILSSIVIKGAHLTTTLPETFTTITPQ